MNDGAVDRILDATFGKYTPEIDRGALKVRLIEIERLYRGGVTVRTARSERRRLIKSSLRRAKRLLKDIEKIFAGTGATWSAEHSLCLQRLIADLHQPDITFSVSEGLFGGRFSEFDTVVHMLRTAFEKFFGPSGYIRRDGSNTYGRFISFVLAALKEMKITHKGRPYSSRAIELAITKLNKASRATQ